MADERWSHAKHLKRIAHNSTASERVVMGKEDDAVPVRPQQHNNVLVYTETPKPILVGAEDFQNLVQSLTSGTRKRKSVTFVPVVVEEEVIETQQETFAQPSSSPAKVLREPLLEYLERLDLECLPSSPRARGNRGFFATAGLVKGVRTEEGLQQFDAPDSPLGSSAALNFEPNDAAEKAAVCGVQILTSASALQGCKLVCSEWVPDWTGCLSPRSGQLVTEAKRTAARWNLSGLEPGPWTINLEKITEYDRCGTDGDECSYPLDAIYYKGEITMEQT